MISKSPKITALMATILTSLLLTACKDDETVPSKHPLLVNKSWTIIRYEMNGDDVTDDFDECELDNTTTFFHDGSFIDSVGSITCDEFDENTEGHWEFKANETIISIHPSGESASDWKILELTENTLKISQYVPWLEADVTAVMGSH